MFLDSICNIIYLIEYGTTKKYVGNYTSYIKQREEEYIKALKDYNRQKKEIKRLEELVDRFKYKPTKAKMAMSKLKQIEKMVKIEKPETFDKKTFKINFNPTTTSYKDVLKLKNLSVGYTKELFNIDLNLEREDKLGIIGDNGIGKSTLIKTITGVIPPIKGKVILGQNVKYAYFSQQLENLNKENTIYDELKNTFNEMTPLEVRTLLGNFNFKGDDVFKQIKDLSGGEKVRVSLCKILNSKPNLLILDEPTNHLDMESITSVNEGMKKFIGNILFTSHDHELTQTVANRIIDIKQDGKVIDREVTYNEYLGVE